jgi:hypothetical protein
MSWSQKGQPMSAAAAIAFAWPRHAAKEIARATGMSLRTAKRTKATGRVSSRWSAAFWAALEARAAQLEVKAAQLRRQVEENRAHARQAAARGSVVARAGGGGATGGEAARPEGVGPPR